MTNEGGTGLAGAAGRQVGAEAAALDPDVRVL